MKESFVINNGNIDELRCCVTNTLRRMAPVTFGMRSNTGTTAERVNLRPVRTAPDHREIARLLNNER